jgi:hypothetical protein
MDRMNRIKGYFEFGDNSHLDYSARRKFYDGEYVIVQDSETGEEKKIRDGWGIYDDGVEKYEGEFADDLYNGKGKIEFASGAIYEGDFYDNKFHGFGTYILPNNTGKYEGDWEQGKWHGAGVYTDADGVEWKGDFYMGKYESPIDVDFGEIRRKEVQLGRSESKMNL